MEHLRGDRIVYEAELKKVGMRTDKKAIFQQMLGGLGTPVGTVNYYPTDPWISEALLKPIPYDPPERRRCSGRRAIPTASRSR